MPKQILKEEREYRTLHSAITSYRDISLIQGGDNLFVPNYSFEMDMDILNDQIENIISQQACFAISKHTNFSGTFLIDIVTDCLFFKSKKSWNGWCDCWIK